MSQQPTVTLVEELKLKALEELKEIHETEGLPSLPALERWRVAYLGRRGALTQALRAVGSLPVGVRGEVGAAGNAAKAALEAALQARQRALQEAELSAAEAAGAVDGTLPGWPLPAGGPHPTTRPIREICQAFASMGFEVVEGPEVEWDRYNFEMLNIPRDHPARDMWNSLWIDYTDAAGYRPMLLRTHTSPMQARIMEGRKPPVRVVVPGRCYRYEATDATHEWHFFQLEGLAVDRGITFADLKGTLYEFARLMFGEERRVRFRCDYFPFVEPGAEMSIDCFLCGGDGCRVCSRTGWIEVLGAGMVHPRVLEGVGYDPHVYTGFAFGMGIERMAMLKHGIDDIRLFYANDLRFLRQF